MPIYRKGDSDWIELANIYRFIDTSWQTINRIFRKTNTNWELIYSRNLNIPTVETAPTLTTASGSSNLFTQIDTITLNRGTWKKTSSSYNPVTYDLRIQKSTNGSAPWIDEVIGTGSTISYSLTQADVRYPSNWYRGRVEVTNSAGPGTEYITTPVRSSFDLVTTTPTVQVLQSAIRVTWSITRPPNNTDNILRQELRIRTVDGYTYNGQTFNANDVVYSNLSIAGGVSTIDVIVAGTNIKPSSNFTASITVVANDTAETSALKTSSSFTSPAAAKEPPTITNVATSDLGGDPQSSPPWPVTVTVTGGSGPAYQIFWSSSSTPPDSTQSPDGSSTTTSITDSSGPPFPGIYYMYARSTETTTTSGSGSGNNATGTYSQWAPSSGYQFAVTATRHLKFDKNTGTTVGNMPSNMTGTDTGTGFLFTIPSNIPTRSGGWTFRHWTLFADGSGTTYSPGSTYNVEGSPVTLYAQWRPQNGTISVSGGNGVDKVTNGATLTVTASSWPSLTQFTYTWYKTRNIQGLPDIVVRTFGPTLTASDSLSVSTIGEEYYCIVTPFLNTGVFEPASVQTGYWIVVPSKPSSYTLANNGNGTFTISGVTISDAAFYFGTWNTSNSIAETNKATSRTITSGAGTVNVRLYSREYVNIGGFSEPFNSWEYTDQSVTVTEITYTAPTPTAVTWDATTWRVFFSGGSGPAYQIWYQPSALVSSTGTIGTVSGSGPYTATITGMSSTSGLFSGAVITTDTGRFSPGTTVSSVINSTSINISSPFPITSGSATNIRYATAPTSTSYDAGGTTSPVTYTLLTTPTTGTSYFWWVRSSATSTSSTSNTISPWSIPFVTYIPSLPSFTANITPSSITLGSSFTASATSISGNPTPGSPAYQWRRFSTELNQYVNVSGAVSSTYGPLSTGTYLCRISIGNAQGTTTLDTPPGTVSSTFSFTPFSFTPQVFSFTPFSFTPQVFSFTPFSFTPFSFTPPGGCGNQCDGATPYGSGYSCSCNG